MNIPKNPHADFILKITLIVAFLFPAAAVLSQNGLENEEDVPLLYVLPFEGEVEIGLVHVLSKGFESAQELGADTILVEMNTPGGRVDAALDIVNLILDSNIPVAVYVKGDATSAGAIISMAADRIYMDELATIGTASPVLIGSGENATMESKALSFVLAKVRGICEAKGFGETKTEIALAMVDKEMEVKDPDNPDVYLTRKGTPLTLTAKEAKRVDFITNIVKTRAEVKEKLGLVDAREIFREEFFSEKIARFLSSTAISSLLLMIGFGGIFVELRTPGFGLPGIVGILAIALFFWGHAIAHLGGWEGPLLFLIGVLLLSLEFFIIPGFGLPGIAGFLCVFASVVVTLLDRPLTDPAFAPTFDWPDFYQAVFISSFAMLVGFSVAMALPLLFPAFVKTRVGGWLLLNDVQERENGYQSAPAAYSELLGKQGLTKSTLRPAGIAEIDGQRVDVVCQGGYIPPRTPIKVINVEGRRIVVRKTG